MSLAGQLASRFGLPDAEMEMVKLSAYFKEGVKKMGIVRATFVIDRDGILKHALYGFNARGHAAEVVNLIKTME